MIINLTPHTVNIFSADGATHLLDIAPSGSVARVDIARVAAGKVDSLPVFTQQRGAVTGLPESAAGTYYLVSAQVRLALAERHDLVSPGELIRNETGQPIGCKGLDANAPIVTETPDDPMVEVRQALAAATAKKDAAKAHMDSLKRFSPEWNQAKEAWHKAQRAETSAQEKVTVAWRIHAPADTREVTHSARSTNGRAGVDVLAHPRYTGKTIMPGKASIKGTANGVRVITVDHAASGFVVVGGDIKPLKDCGLMVDMGLQSSRSIGVLNAVEGAMWTEYGYKRRSSATYKIQGGLMVVATPAETLDI